MAKTYYTYRLRVANYERVQVEKWNAQHQSLGEPSEGIYPSSVTLRKHLPFLNSRAFVYEVIARFFSNNKYSHQVFLIE
jgi:hypothetical protein